MTRMAADAKDLLSASIRVIFSAICILHSAFCIPLPREGERPRKPHRFPQIRNPQLEGPSVFGRACKPLLIRDIQLILAPLWLDGFEKVMAGVEFGGGVGLPALHPALAGL